MPGALGERGLAERASKRRVFSGTFIDLGDLEEVDGHHRFKTQNFDGGVGLRYFTGIDCSDMPREY